MVSLDSEYGGNVQTYGVLDVRRGAMVARLGTAGYVSIADAFVVPAPPNGIGLLDGIGIVDGTMLAAYPGRIGTLAPLPFTGDGLLDQVGLVDGSLIAYQRGRIGVATMPMTTRLLRPSAAFATAATTGLLDAVGIVDGTTLAFQPGRIGTLAPSTTPVPAPTPSPTPTPVPTPTPGPTGATGPAPVPTPTPNPTPAPSPTPVPTPSPNPTPSPVPSPTPGGPPAAPNTTPQEAVFIVTLDTPAQQTAIVRWATVDDTATAPNDYTASEGVLTFLPGETAKAIVVAVRPYDNQRRASSFGVHLRAGNGAVIVQADAVAVIPGFIGILDDVSVVDGKTAPFVPGLVAVLD